MDADVRAGARQDLANGRSYATRPACDYGGLACQAQ